MLKNYLTIALRTIRREKGYAAINVFGLALGIACCLLIGLWVQDELGYDRFHEKADRIYRIVEARQSPEGREQHFVYTAGPLGPTLVEAHPDVSSAVRVLNRQTTGRMTIERGEARFYSGAHLYTESSFFDVFDFPLVQGDPNSALANPNTVVLTEETATLLFGEEDPVGKTITAESFGELTVTGLLRDLPKNSHLQFSMLISLATIQADEEWRDWIENEWGSDGIMTYLVLNPGSAPDAVEAEMAALLERHQSADAEQGRRAVLQALPTIHFQSAHIEFDENGGKSSVAYLYIFSAIALFILLIACINYMNLATARSTRRAKEIGVRKAIGALRGQLARQMLSESVLTALLALVLALVLAAAALPAFNALSGKALALTAEIPLLLGLLMLTLGVGVVAGSYPAFVLARLRPVGALRGQEGPTGGAARLRRALVVVQFTLAIVIIVATVVVGRQLDYIQNKPLGFKEDHLVVIDINSGNVRRDFETVKAAFADVPGVERVTVSSRVPGEWKNLTQIEVTAVGAPEPSRNTMHFIGADEDFLGTYEMTLLAGRNFSAARPADSAAVLLNETAARMLGWTDAPLGQRLRVPDEAFEGEVIGIVADFHFRSLHEPIGPLVLGYHTNPVRIIDYFTARIAPADVPATLDGLRDVGERFDPATPFEYNFLNERLADFYVAEARVGRLFRIAAGLALLVACLGLFGLATFLAERRTKEVGIRKVLGASVSNLIVLLSKDFARLVLIAFVLAAPVAYFLMGNWLESFAYRIALGPGVFLLAGVVALLVALLTVSYHAFRAATADPVKSLRSE